MAFSLSDLDQFRKVFVRNRRVAFLSAVVIFAVWAFAEFGGGYLTEQGKRSASIGEALKAEPSATVESRGDASPNIVGNRGQVRIEIQQGTAESSDENQEH